MVPARGLTGSGAAPPNCGGGPPKAGATGCGAGGAPKGGAASAAGGAPYCGAGAAGGGAMGACAGGGGAPPMSIVPLKGAGRAGAAGAGAGAAGAAGGAAGRAGAAGAFCAFIISIVPLNLGADAPLTLNPHLVQVAAVSGFCVPQFGQNTPHLLREWLRESKSGGSLLRPPRTTQVSSARLIRPEGVGGPALPGREPGGNQGGGGNAHDACRETCAPPA